MSLITGGSKPRKASAARKQEARFGRLAILPALILILVFSVAPTLLAFGLSLFNARLVSPNAPDFVGLDNFWRLLSLEFRTVLPLHDQSGHLVRDATGALQFPAARDIQHGVDPLHLKLELSSWLTDGGRQKIYILAGDPLFWKSLANTLVFVIVVVPVQAGIALLLALFVNIKRIGANFFRTIIFIPVVTSMIVISILWLFMYQKDGLINNIISAINPTYVPVDWLGNPKTALFAIIVMSIWQAVGFHMIIWLSGLQTIAAELYEAATIDGANPFQRFAHVTWPSLRNTRIFILITITIAAFGLFAQVNVMTKGGPLDSTTTLVYQAFLAAYGRQQMGYGSAIAVVFFGIVLIVSLVQRRLTRDKD